MNCGVWGTGEGNAEKQPQILHFACPDRDRVATGPRKRSVQDDTVRIWRLANPPFAQRRRERVGQPLGWGNGDCDPTHRAKSSSMDGAPTGFVTSPIEQRAARWMGQPLVLQPWPDVRRPIYGGLARWREYLFRIGGNAETANDMACDGGAGDGGAAGGSRSQRRSAHQSAESRSAGAGGLPALLRS